MYSKGDGGRSLAVPDGSVRGDFQGRGLDHLVHPGLLRRGIGGHWSATPALRELAVNGGIEAYNLPLGCMAQLFRDIAAGKPGSLSRVGLGTFVDPRQGGGKVNQRTNEDLIELIMLDGEEYLLYKSFRVDVALLRGTTADPSGNVTMEREALTADALAIATAAHNSRGLVIVQVERIAERGSLNARDVRIPGALVDCVVLGEICCEPLERSVAKATACSMPSVTSSSGRSARSSSASGALTSVRRSADTSGTFSFSAASFSMLFR